MYGTQVKVHSLWLRDQSDPARHNEPTIDYQGGTVPRSRVRGFSAAHLRRRRDARHLTQSELASAIGVSPRSVQAWEADDFGPDEPTLATLATALHCDVRELVRIDAGDVRLADLRTFAGLLLGDAAEQLGWHRATLRALEHGERPANPGQRAQLAELYQVSAETLDAAAQCTADYRATAIRAKVNPPT